MQVKLVQVGLKVLAHECQIVIFEFIQMPSSQLKNGIDSINFFQDLEQDISLNMLVLANYDVLFYRQSICKSDEAETLRTEIFTYRNMTDKEVLQVKY